jgi:hypothetical protein
MIFQGTLRGRARSLKEAVALNTTYTRNPLSFLLVSVCHLSVVKSLLLIMVNTDTPTYLTSDNARYTLGIHRGPLVHKNAESAQLEQLAQVESAGGLSLQTRQLKKREKFQRHWKRFWCLHLFVTIIFLAILLPIL